MSALRISPLEPRQAGNLKGFGFTVSLGDPQSVTAATPLPVVTVAGGAPPPAPSALQSQAKASEDNGRTSAMMGVPVPGEVSRLVSGRTETATSDHGRDSRERPAPFITSFCTSDGNWIARCTRTGVSASGPTQAEAEAECRRLAAGARVAA